MPSVEADLATAQSRWVGHVLSGRGVKDIQRMGFIELKEGQRPLG